MKKNTKVLLKKIIRPKTFIFGLISVFIVLFIVIPDVYSTNKQEQFANQLFFCPMPENTEIVEIYSETSNLAPTGDNMCFIAIALVKSELTKDELYEYFDAQNLKNALTKDITYEAVLEIQKAEANADLVPEVCHYNSFRFEYMYENNDAQNMYYVIIYDQTSLPNAFFGILYG